MLQAPCFAVRPPLAVSGDDPLDLGSLHDRLFGAVFPGVNNVVSYVRVYAALLWMMRRVNHRLQTRPPGSVREAKAVQDQALEKVQLALLWANKGKGYGRLTGIDRDFPSDDSPVELRFSGWKEAAALLTAVSYRPSLTNGLGFAQVRDGWVYQCTPAGEALAEAFDAQARHSPMYEWLGDLESVTARCSDIESLADVLDVGRPTDGEQQAFLARFFPGEPDASDALQSNRWTGLQLMLRSIELLERVSGNAQTEDAIRACMAQGGALGQTLALGPLEDVCAAWAFVQLRALYRVALDSLFGAVEVWLKHFVDVPTPKDIDSVATAVGQLARSQAKRLSEMFTELAHVQGAHPGFLSRGASVSLGDRWTLHSQTRAMLVAEAGFEEDGSMPVVTAALAALTYVAHEVMNLKKVPVFEEVLALDTDSVSVHALVDLAGRMVDERPAVFLSHVVKQFVVQRHFEVVTARTRPGEEPKNRYRFFLGDAGLEVFAPARPVLNGGLTQDRLGRMLDLATQCGLLLKLDEGWRLAPEGVRRLV